MKPGVASCPALILAGGLGARLRPVYNRGPKCLAPVGGRPFLEYLLRWIQSAGVQDLILCVGHKRAQIRNWLRDGSRWGLSVRYCVERELRGTAGALRLAARMTEAPDCLALNGDSMLEVNLQEMWRFHRSQQALATIALARVRDTARYGGVRVVGDGRIAAFREKGGGAAGTPSRHQRYQLINGGVYLLQRRFFDLIPAGRAVSIEKEIFPALAGRKLYGFVTKGFFIDIGVPADYARAQTELPERFGHDHTS